MRSTSKSVVIRETRPEATVKAAASSPMALTMLSGRIKQPRLILLMKPNSPICFSSMGFCTSYIQITIAGLSGLGDFDCFKRSGNFQDRVIVIDPLAGIVQTVADEGGIFNRFMLAVMNVAAD